jgi:hypothetical protein
MALARPRQLALGDFEITTDRQSSQLGPEPPSVIPDTCPPRNAWEEEVHRFLRRKRSETSVGEDRIRRMRWELIRFPDLFLKAGALSVATIDPVSGCNSTCNYPVHRRLNRGPLT